MAEDTGLEPAGLLHLTRFPGELLSHSVNPPYLLLWLQPAESLQFLYFCAGNRISVGNARYLYNITKKDEVCKEILDLAVVQNEL